MKPLDLDKRAEKPVEAPAAAAAAEEKIDFSKVEIEPLFADLLTLRLSPSLISALSRCLTARLSRSRRSS